MFIRMFADGSAKGNGKADAKGGYAAVIYAQTESGIVKKEVHGKKEGATNNEMELMAILEGLKGINAGARAQCKVHIQSDSKYVVNIFSQWIADWKKRGWKKKSSGEITNLELIKMIDELKAEYDSVKFEHVPRCSNPWIKRADELAQG